MKKTKSKPTAALLLLLAAPTATRANHVHLQIAWRQDALVLEVYDFEAGAQSPGTYPFAIGNAGMTLIPAASAFSFLGEAGATFFALPQSENPNLPFLGIGVDHAPVGTFSGNRVNLRLVSINGPGHFALYQVNAFGQPTLQMNTRDGIAPDSDRLMLVPGAHEHQNWAFSAPGEYEVTFVANAVRQTTGQPIASAPATYHFRVFPPPAAQLTLTPGAGNDFDLVVQSRAGARLQLLETVDFVSWTTNATALLANSNWQTNWPGTDSRRFCRIEEVFP